MENRNYAPTVSVIIPVYNVEAYVEKCLSSVVNQTYKNLQILVIDDCSTDNSLQVIEAFLEKEKDKRLQLIRHKKNSGLSAARNTGLNIISGDLVQFVDSDDWCELDMIEKMVQVIHNNDCDIVNCNINIYDEQKKQFYKGETFLKGLIDSATAMEALLLIKEPPSMWRNLYKSYLFNNIRFEVGIYFEDKILQPYIWAKAKSIFFLNEHLYNYLINRKGSIIANSNLDTKFNNYLLFNSFKRLRKDLLPTLFSLRADKNWTYLINYYDYIFFRNLCLLFVSSHKSYDLLLSNWLKLCQKHLKWGNLFSLLSKKNYKDFLHLMILKISRKMFWSKFASK